MPGADPGFPGGRFTAWVHAHAGPRPKFMCTLLKMGCSVACLKMTPQGCKLVAIDTFDLFILKVKFSRFPQTL